MFSRILRRTPAANTYLSAARKRLVEAAGVEPDPALFVKW